MFSHVNWHSQCNAALQLTLGFGLYILHPRAPTTVHYIIILEHQLLAEIEKRNECLGKLGFTVIRQPCEHTIQTSNTKSVHCGALSTSLLTDNDHYCSRKLTPGPAVGEYLVKFRVVG